MCGGGDIESVNVRILTQLPRGKPMEGAKGLLPSPSGGVASSGDRTSPLRRFRAEAQGTRRKKGQEGGYEYDGNGDLVRVLYPGGIQANQGDGGVLSMTSGTDALAYSCRLAVCVAGLWSGVANSVNNLIPVRGGIPGLQRLQDWLWHAPQPVPGNAGGPRRVREGGVELRVGAWVALSGSEVVSRGGGGVGGRLR